MNGASNYQKYTKYLLASIALVILFFIYQLNYNDTLLKNNKASADYLVNDPTQQQHFSNVSTNTNFGLSSNNSSSLECDCEMPLISTLNISVINHGEKLPVIVPEFMPTLDPEIGDKLELNKREDNTVLITVAGYGMKTELYNWIKLIEQAGETQFLVFCTDKKLFMHLLVAGYEDKAALIPDDWFINDIELFRNTELSLLDQDKNPRLSHVKTWILQRLIYTEPYLIFFLDVNQIIVKERTLEYIQTLMNIRGDTKIIATQDSLNQHVINTGLMLFRSNAQEPKRVLAKTIAIQEEQPELTQQDAFNKALDQISLHVKTGMLVLLDIMHFPNGAHYFKNNLPKSKGIKPYIVHLNHKFGEERRELLKKHKFWAVNEEYIDYLSYQADQMWQRQQERLAIITRGEEVQERR